jgi:type II secretory pathway pseudopilin PulG
MFRHSAARPRITRVAFTVIELVVVLLIMGIVAAAAAPTFYRSLLHHQLESAARRVKIDLEQLQHTARVKSRGQSVTFDGAAYTLSTDVVDLDHPGAVYSVDLAASPYELESVSIDFGGGATIAFDGYGAAQQDAAIVLGLGGQTRTVTLESSTGQVSVTNP